MSTVLEREEAAAPAALGGSLPAILLRHGAEKPDRVALRKKSMGRWREYTWREYAERSTRIGLGLVALGVERGDRIAVHSENRPAWVLADMGAQGIGAVTVGIYPTSPAPEVEYLLGHSESVVLICEDEEQFDKVMEVRERLPSLKKIVVIDTRGIRDLDDPMVMTFADLEALGTQADAAEYHRRVEAIEPDDTAIIVYTSGTTGPPKGAMITHANMAAAARHANALFEVDEDSEVLSYLPLCHIAERLISVINGITWGYIVNFGEGGDTFAQDLREVQPTFFLGVPRVWEKMLAGIQIRMGDASWIKRRNYAFWVKRGEKIAKKRMAGKAGPGTWIVYFLGWLLLYRSIREKLGMLRVRGALSGAAPIAPQVLEYFWSIGVPVLEGYGQTENTAQATYTRADNVRIGAVGQAAPGVEIRIAADGEILTRSEGNFKGYFKNEAATKDTLTADNWLHTGDIGELDEDGFLTITDRKKDIIITAGGKNISPSEIENLLKVSPYIREAIVIGDRRKYLTALIGIEADTVGDWAQRRRIIYTTYEDLASKPEVRELIDGVVQETNSHLAQVETIKRFELLHKELDQEDGELTATQKVKRASIAKEFADTIEGMYR